MKIRSIYIAVVASVVFFGSPTRAAWIDDLDTRALWHIDAPPSSSGGWLVTLDDNSSGRSAVNGILNYAGSASQPTYWGGESIPGHSGFLQFLGDDDILAPSAWGGEDTVRVDLLVDFHALPSVGERVGIVQSIPWRLFAKNTDGQVRFELHVLNAAEDGYTVAASQVTLGIYIWYDVRFEIANGTALISVEGIENAVSLAGGMSSSTSDVVVGRNMDGGEFFHGLLDEIRVAIGPVVLPEESKPRPELEMTNGRPIIHIDGKPRVPFLFRGNYQMDGNPVALDHVVNQIDRSYGFGQRMYAINSQTSWWNPYSQINADNAVRMGAAPEGKFFVSLGITPNYTWANNHLSEIYTDESGTTYNPHPTVESSLWRTESSDQVHEWAQNLKTTPYADNVFALNLACHSSAEWFLLDAFGESSPIKHYDFSSSNLAGFRNCCAGERHCNKRGQNCISEHHISLN